MMVTLLAIPLLGEKFGWYKSLAVVSGFIGVVFIMEPWSEDFNIIIFLPVVAALGYSLARVTALNFTNDVPTPIINLYGQLGTMLCSIFLVLIFSMWENFKNAYDIFILFIMGVAGGTGTYF